MKGPMDWGIQKFHYPLLTNFNPLHLRCIFSGNGSFKTEENRSRFLGLRASWKDLLIIKAALRALHLALLQFFTLFVVIKSSSEFAPDLIRGPNSLAEQEMVRRKAFGPYLRSHLTAVTRQQ